MYFFVCPLYNTYRHSHYSVFLTYYSQISLQTHALAHAFPTSIPTHSSIVTPDQAHQRKQHMHEKQFLPLIISADKVRVYDIGDLNSNCNNSNGTDSLVVNLSDYTLNEHEISILSKGMKFCPTPGEPNFGALREDLDHFHTRIKRKLFFSNLPVDEENNPTGSGNQHNDDDAFKDSKFKEASKWKPPPIVNLEIFCRQNEYDLLKHKVPPNKFHNLTKPEKDAIKSLMSNKNIVIKPADKGGAVVVMNVTDYINEGLRQLTDAKFYIETEIDLTHTHTLDINTFLDKLLDEREIDDKCHQFLHIDKERTSLFYMLPKIHKRKENPPGRPIVSGNGCPTERISQLVDYFLQPTVKALPSYVRDTTHFLSRLNDLGDLPENCVLATLDVASLYTNIPNDIGIQAARETLETFRSNLEKPSTDNLMILLDKVLKMNNFDFANRHFLQIGGTAMGTKVAPSFANTFMGWFESKYVYTYRLQPLLWVRFIDDIFVIWQHGRSALKAFETHLNQCIPSIKFETDISDTQVHFLDVTVTLTNATGEISTSLYTKPTDAHNYLSFKSCHPRNCKSSIPYSQFLRLRRICSDINDFTFHAREMTKHFLKAKYPPKIMQEAFSKAFHLNRHTLLNPPNKEDEATELDEIFLITTYHPGGRILGDIVHQNWDILDKSSSTREVLDWKVTQGFRRPKNIRDLLVRALVQNPLDVKKVEYPPRKYKRNFCTRKGCRYCNKLDTSGNIRSPITGRNYNTIRCCSCKTNNIIYCITCQICFKQYIGHTKRTLGERMCEHFRYITQHNSTHSVGRHFNMEDHQGLGNVKLHVLQFGRKDPDSQESLDIRLELERLWIHRLRSTTPMGLNVFD